MDAGEVVSGVIAISALGTMVGVIYTVVKSRGTCPGHQDSFTRLHTKVETIEKDLRTEMKSAFDAKGAEMIKLGNELTSVREQIKALNDNMASFREYLKGVVDILLKRYTEQ